MLNKTAGLINRSLSKMVDPLCLMNTVYTSMYSFHKVSILCCIYLFRAPIFFCLAQVVVTICSHMTRDLCQFPVLQFSCKRFQPRQQAKLNPHVTLLGVLWIQFWLKLEFCANLENKFVNFIHISQGLKTLI